MAKLKHNEEPFYARLAAIMVREDKNCWQAATDLELGLTNEECTLLMKNQRFQQILRTERLKLYNELASDPNRSKHTLIGQAMFCVEKLMEQDSYDKALAGLLNIAKIEGFVGSDTNVNVFAGLSSRELAELKQKLKSQKSDMTDLPLPSAQA